MRELTKFEALLISSCVIRIFMWIGLGSIVGAIMCAHFGLYYWTLSSFLAAIACLIIIGVMRWWPELYN